MEWLNGWIENELVTKLKQVDAWDKLVNQLNLKEAKEQHKRMSIKMNTIQIQRNQR